MALHLNLRAVHRTLLRHRIKVLAGIAVWTFVFMTGVMYYRMNRSVHQASLQSLADRMQSQRKTEHREEEDPITSYCNHPHLIRSKAELLPQSLMSRHRLSLVSVIQLVRHGDRGPLRPVRNFHSIPHNPFQMPDDQAHRIVREKELLQIFEVFNRSQVALSHLTKTQPFDLIPNSRSRLGQLTVLGALQHLKLGLEVGKVYAEHLNPEKQLATISRSLAAHSTHYERTFQSATAFLFGFLNHTHSTPDQVMRLIADKLETSQGSFICSYPEYCADCEKMKSLNKEWDQMREDEVKSHPAIADLLSKLAHCLTPSHTESNYSIGASRDAKSVGDLSHPNAAVDGLMAYLCHDAPLPCSSTDVCASVEDSKRVVAFINSCFQKLAVNEAFVRNSMLKVRGLFQRIINHFKQISDGKDFPLFSLLSAHDITLVPVASVLGFWDATMPPYASRITFEAYEQKTSDQKDSLTNGYYFRVLYNGKDMTRNTEICKSFTRCASLEPVSQDSDTRSSSKTPSSHPTTFTLIPIDYLDSFIRQKFVKLSTTDNYADACRST